MTVQTKKNGTTLAVAVEGRIDTKTAPAFEAEVKKNLDGVTNLVIDFAQLNYISSAGLRVLLFLENATGGGNMVIKNPNESVMDVFEVTGLSEVFTIE